MERYVVERRGLGELAPTSARTVLYTLRDFVRIVGDIAAKDLTADHVREWLLRTRFAPSTERNRLSQVRTFCGWLIDRGYLTRDPTRGVKGATQPRYLPRSIRADQVGSAFGACPDARAELVISLEVQECLRVGEVAAVQLGDVDWANRELLVHGKGRRERVVPISDETLAALERYLDEHPAHAGPLIRSYNHPNRGISAAYVSTLSARWIRAGGTNATGHQLRHTGATDLRRAGTAIDVIQELLGHALLSTTQIYVGRVPSTELRAAIVDAGRRYRGPLPVHPGQQAFDLAETKSTNRKAATR